MGVDIEMPAGAWDCELEAPVAGIGRNNDVLGQFLAQYDINEAFYRASVMGAFAGLDLNGDGLLQSDEYLAQQFADGQTYEQALLGHTVFSPGSERENTRLTAELNVEIGDGLLQLLGMSTEDNTFNWNDGDSTGSLAAFSVNMMTMLTSVGGNVMSMLVPIEIDESYAEVRWISPDQEQLRYTLSASYYDYSLQQQVYNNGGAFFYDLVIEDATHANFGEPVNPNTGITISEVATNTGLSFGVNYDLTDRTTFSLEARYQTDEVCGVDEGGANIKACQETTSFLPRVAVNTTFSNQLSGYAQISLGNNPAGVNIAYQDPGNVESLLVASGQIVNPDTGFTYDGTDGLHFPTVDYDASTFPTFEEEELTNFEVGAKGSFADRRGSYTAAAYFMIYKNIIGAENLNWTDTTEEDLTATPPVIGGWNESNWTAFTGERTWLNQGDGEMYGVELTADYVLSDTWQVGGYLTLSSAKYTDFCSIQAPGYRDAPGGAGGGGANIIPILTPAADGVLSSCGVVDGNWIPKQTPFTANVNVSANLPNDLFGLRTSLRADVRHKGAYYEDHLNTLERSAVTTVNVSANLRSDDWTVRLYVDNVTDQRQPSRVSTGNDYITGPDPSVAPSGIPTWSIVGARPREMGLQLQYSF